MALTLNRRVEIRLSQEQYAAIESRMKDMGIANMSQFIRKMALQGMIVKLNIDEIEENARLLGVCSNNMNQYAKRANETGSIYAEDISDVKKRLDEINMVYKQLLDKLNRL